MPEKQIDPGHKAARNTLRVVGPLVALIGAGFAVVGFVDFFSAFGGSRAPHLFWCAFVGLPLLGLGVTLTKFAYLGRIMRYMGQEAAPPVQDTFNFLAEGTKDGVRTVASALGQGLREGGFGGGSQTMVRCHKCNALAPADARFCGQCGQSLGKTKPCPACHEGNDPDAKFCDNCGRALG